MDNDYLNFVDVSLKEALSSPILLITNPPVCICHHHHHYHNCHHVTNLELTAILKTTKTLLSSTHPLYSCPRIRQYNLW